MHRLRDTRVDLQLDVHVWGLDELGKAFAHPARTIEVGALGAQLCCINGMRQNDVIGIQHRNQKARFRVVWTGGCKSEQEGQVGVECVEPGKCIWTAALEAAQFRAAERVTSVSPIFLCSGTITLMQESGEVLTALKLSDLSLGLIAVLQRKGVLSRAETFGELGLEEYRRVEGLSYRTSTGQTVSCRTGASVFCPPIRTRSRNFEQAAQPGESDDLRQSPPLHTSN